MSKPNIAFLGLGLMGRGMAARLLAHGFGLTVYNRSAPPAAPLARAGAKRAKSPREAASGNAIVMVMVADDTASRALWLGDEGALAGLAPGTVLVDSSTLSVGWVKELAAAAQAKRCPFLDAPVTGTRPHAAAGELTFLVGGPAAALETARPVLEAMSKQIVHLGNTGSGALMKLVNNFLSGVQAAALAEALVLIERGGLDRDQALGVLKTGAPGSPLVKTLSDRMTSDKVEPSFHLRLMAKDLAYAIAEGKDRRVELNTAKAALEIFNQSVDAGDGEKDFSAIIERVRRAGALP